ncbi:MAG TPA: mannose-1-phosphate guanylyltransferase/mannose-6-phosphate isomerase [Succinivibrionaceae bacterium]|nr:mannose-1-phosphate guanylyltransferase/mannose-6-phosphate isomerase [Succinivibrionaceae bacterium]
MKAVILAGGSGSRLWPLSREAYPKQLITREHEYSMLQQSFRRLNRLCEAKDIVTITNVKVSQDVKLQLNLLDKENVVLGEPLARNTAPAVACALEYLKKRPFSSDDVVLIVPSDHYIKSPRGFFKAVKKAQKLAEEGYIVTFGIKPTYPETGYGYVKTASVKDGGFIVDSFVEKPDLETANAYLASGNYYWNGGMFMGKISVILGEYEKLCPEIFNLLSSIDFSKANNKIPFEPYESMPSISIDYAIMEKSEKISLVELKAGWSDLGSWKSIYDAAHKDPNGNVLSGKVITNNISNSLIYSQKEVVAASDLQDLILVETEDAIMACRLSESQHVKQLYEKLKEKQSDTVKLHKTVFRPWGYYTNLNEGDGYLTKVICVMPHQKLSIQSHNHRSEHWVVLEGKALVIKDDHEYFVYPGESIDIPLQSKHSLQNPYDTELKVIEVQKGDYIAEDDIVRYEDIYGRV